MNFTLDCLLSGCNERAYEAFVAIEMRVLCCVGLGGYIDLLVVGPEERPVEIENISWFHSLDMIQ